MESDIASFRRVHRPSAACVVVEGELDAGSVGRFTTAIFDVVIVDDRRAVLDLSRVTFFGSEAITSLITGQTSRSTTASTCSSSRCAGLIRQPSSRSRVSPTLSSSPNPSDRVRFAPAESRRLGYSHFTRDGRFLAVYGRAAVR